MKFPDFIEVHDNYFVDETKNSVKFLTPEGFVTDRFEKLNFGIIAFLYEPTPSGDEYNLVAYREMTKFTEVPSFRHTLETFERYARFVKEMKLGLYACNIDRDINDPSLFPHYSKTIVPLVYKES